MLEIEINQEPSVQWKDIELGELFVQDDVLYLKIANNFNGKVDSSLTKAGLYNSQAIGRWLDSKDFDNTVTVKRVRKIKADIGDPA